MRSKVQILIGIALFTLGIYFDSFKSRPWYDFDFIVAWYGLLLFLDGISGATLFKNIRNFLLLAFTSSMFWWFYEWANLYLQNWHYPLLPLYSQMELGLVATIAFTTVLPLLVVSTNLTTAVFKKLNTNLWTTKKQLTQVQKAILILLGLTCLLLSVAFPLYFFGLIWLVIFLLFDNRLIPEALAGNFKPLLVLALSALIAGMLWETVNFLILKWTYSIPFPITIKFFEMPVVGLLGYIPFCWGAFAFVKFLNINVPWLEEKS